MNDIQTLLEISNKRNDDLNEKYRILLSEHNVTRDKLRTAVSILADLIESTSNLDSIKTRANGCVNTYLDQDQFLSPSSYEPDVA